MKRMNRVLSLLLVLCMIATPASSASFGDRRRAGNCDSHHGEKTGCRRRLCQKRFLRKHRRSRQLRLR